MWHSMEMARTKRMVSYALDNTIIETLEQYIASGDHEFPPKTTAVVEPALREFFERRGFPKRAKR